MNYSDKLAFMPLRYLLPLLWLIIILGTSLFSYTYINDSLSLCIDNQEEINQIKELVFLDTLLLISLMLIFGIFSYFVINKRYKQLLSIISSYKQGMDGKQEVIEGNDEISAISKAFCNMSKRMNAVLDDMYTFVAVLDTTGHILFVNNTPLQVSGLSSKDVKAKKLSDTYWWAYDSKRKDEISDLIDRCIKGEIINYETQIQVFGGQLIWITFSLHPVYDSEGNIEHLVAEGVDISRQKQAYEEMLAQSRKAQMGEMISVIAHQWRQPLGVIGSVTGQIELSAELDTLDKYEIKKNMKKINETVEHLSSTMQQFTSFFNPNKKAQRTSFSSIVENSMTILGSSLQTQGININVNIMKEEHFISFEDELMQVLMDMLKNSADFFLQNKIETPFIEIEQFLKDGFICLSISDNAGGIDDEAIKHLFDPYFSTKEDEKGSGLGLHMSKMIVQDHCDGKIEVEQLDGGARFIICLPS